MTTVDVWITQDQREIPITEMSKRHLVNAWKFFSARAAVFALASDVTGTKAERKLLHEIRRRQRDGIKERLDKLRREIKRRELEVEGV